MNSKTVSPDRQRVSTQRMWAVTLLTGAMLWSALSSLASGNGRVSSAMVGQAAAVCAVLAIFGLRSVPLRWIVRGLALLSGLTLARFGQLGLSDGLSGSWRVLAWLGAFGAALTLAPSSRSVVGLQSDGDDPAMSVASDSRGRVSSAIAIAAISLVAGAALIMGPRISNWFPTGASAGDLIDHSQNSSSNVLVSRDRLDMTSRPDLTDKIVMSVRSPLVMFWRAEIFDRWNGTAWTRSYERTGSLLRNGRVTPAIGDVAARLGTESTQVFKLESGFATVMPSAASAVRVDSVDEVGQRPDGTLVAPYSPLGSGATYTVHSRQIPLSANMLRSAGSASSMSTQTDGGPRPGRPGSPAGSGGARSDRVTDQIVGQYALPPVATDRVVDLARKVSSTSTNDYDRVLALENWMSSNTTYSINAPLSPKGVDVVDDFLFNSREGWCEQIASSLVVMARAVGIPARLVTGYAPGEWDSAGRRFVVRERDAHAWAEVWFPDAGWVPFDPTAAVPLSGSDEAAAGASARDWREILGLALVVFGLLSLSASPVSRVVARVFDRFRRTRERRKLADQRWDVAAGVRLELIGAQVGRARAVDETLTRYGEVLSEQLGDPRLADVGMVLDRVAFGPNREPVPQLVGAVVDGADIGSGTGDKGDGDLDRGGYPGYPGCPGGVVGPGDSELHTRETSPATQRGFVESVLSEY